MKPFKFESRDVYLKSLIQKTEHFVRRLRWKVFHFLSDSKNDDHVKSTFGFTSPLVPPKNQLIYEFENDQYNIIQHIKFKKIHNKFQRQLLSDIQEIKNSGKVIVHADKTRNMYELDSNEYKKLLNDNITKTYKKCDQSVVKDVNKEASKIVDKLGLCDRVQVIAEKPAFITIKDHKPHFPNNIQCRLLNPCKSQVGKISKEYLECMNSKIRESANLNQWRNTNEVIEWFKQIPNKTR